MEARFRTVAQKRKSPAAAEGDDLEDGLKDSGGAEGGENGQLCVKVPVLLDRLGAAFFEEIVDGTCSEDETKSGD